MNRLPIDIQELIWRKSFDMCLKDINNAYQVRLERLDTHDYLNRNIFVKSYRDDGKYQILCYPTRTETNLNEINYILHFFQMYVIIGIEPMLNSEYNQFYDRLNYYQDKYKTDPNLIYHKL
jgi:hypothetical protein